MTNAPTPNVDAVAAQLRIFATDGRDVALLRTYYRLDKLGIPVFSGAAFDRKTDSSPGTFTEHDLLDLSLLSVPVKGAIVKDLRAGYFDLPITSDGQSLNALLAQVSKDASFESCLDDAYATHLGPGSPVDTLWRELRTASKARGWKLGQTRTSKLLAAKRPALVPVYDSAVKDLFGLKDSGAHWDTTRALLQSDGILEGIRAAIAGASNSIPAISVVRALDVILWMHGSGKTSQDEAR